MPLEIRTIHENVGEGQPNSITISLWNYEFSGVIALRYPEGRSTESELLITQSCYHYILYQQRVRYTRYLTLYLNYQERARQAIKLLPTKYKEGLYLVPYTDTILGYDHGSLGTATIYGEIHDESLDMG